MQTLVDERVVSEENELPPQEEFEEDMPLRNEHKNWINEQITVAIAELNDSLKPHGFRRVMYWMKEWGAISAIWAVPLALLTMVITLGIFAINNAVKNATFQTDTNRTLQEISKRLDKIDQSFVTEKLDRFNSLPITPQNTKQVTEIVKNAQLSGLKIDPSVVSTTGKAYLEASVSQPEAWTAAAAILQYKTSLNAAFVPSNTEKIPYAIFNIGPGIPSAPEWSGKIGYIGLGVGPETADLHYLKNPPKDQLRPNVDASFMVLHGGNFTLDGFFLKRVILVNAHIIYKGGPVHLDMVYFVNCTFDIDRQSKSSMMLADAVLSKDPATSFIGE